MKVILCALALPILAATIYGSPADREKRDSKIKDMDTFIKRMEDLVGITANYKDSCVATKKGCRCEEQDSIVDHTDVKDCKSGGGRGLFWSSTYSARSFVKETSKKLCYKGSNCVPEYDIALQTMSARIGGLKDGCLPYFYGCRCVVKGKIQDIDNENQCMIFG